MIYLTLSFKRFVRKLLIAVLYDQECYGFNMFEMKKRLNMRKNRSGSALIDYVLPTALVGLVVGLSMYSMFSTGTLANFIGASSNTEMDLESGEGVMGDVVTNSSGFSESASTVISTGTVGDVDVSYYANGTASFTVGTQNVTVSSDMMNNLNEIMETTGTTGLNNHIVSSIKKLIEEHADEYPGEDVPIEYMTGLYQRSFKDWNYYGAAKANVVQMTVGDHMIVIGKDHEEEKSGTNEVRDVIEGVGVHIFEGTRDGNNINGTFTAGEFSTYAFSGGCIRQSCSIRHPDGIWDLVLNPES